MFSSKATIRISKTALASAVVAWLVVQVVPIAYILWSMGHASEISVGVVTLVYVLAMVIAPLAAYAWNPLQDEGEIVGTVTRRWRLILTALAVIVVAGGIINEYALWREARILEVCTSYARDLSPILNGTNEYQERSFNQCLTSLDGAGWYDRLKYFGY